jgi:hypothetical protein
MIAPGNHVIEKSAALCNTPGGGNVVRCKIKQLAKPEFEENKQPVEQSTG